MDPSKLDDDLFERAISSYRDVFLVHYAHLPEEERNQLWTKRLTHFIPAPSSSKGRTVGPDEAVTTGLSNTDEHSGTADINMATIDLGPSSEYLGKRTRHDASRQPPGFQSAKRRATVCLPGSTPLSLSLPVIPFVPPVYLGYVPWIDC